MVLPILPVTQLGDGSRLGKRRPRPYKPASRLPAGGSGMKILFVTNTRIGDAVLSTGLLGWLIARYPGARLTIACGPEAVPLFAATPGLERVIPMPKERWGGHWFRLWRQVVTTRWGLVVDLRGSLLGQFLVARQRKVLMPRASGHRLLHLASLFRLTDPPPPRIWVAQTHRTAARQLIPAGGPVLGLGPTANWGGKVWPAERFAAACRRLTAADGILPDARVAVFGGPGEEAMAAPVLAAIPAERRIDLVGRTDLLTVYACMERLALYIGNDSALMHLAAASGVPTLGLFGPSREDQYAPWGANAAFVRTPESFDQIVRAPGYDYRSQETRMGSLSVEAVVEAAIALWRRRGGG
jgi:ADP-heptose:LPS heptosyltransferase